MGLDKYNGKYCLLQVDELLLKSREEEVKQVDERD